jgi:predicted transcriptional regulator YheO
MLDRFTAVDPDLVVRETLQGGGADGIRQHIDEFASKLGTTPRHLKIEDRRALIQDLKKAGYLEIRRAPEIIASHIGVSRGTVYADAK